MYPRSPEDQAILEAEYRKNPKPDKAARMGIVQRVALGEKEVQVCPALVALLSYLADRADLVPKSTAEHAQKVETTITARDRPLSTIKDAARHFRLLFRDT